MIPNAVEGLDAKIERLKNDIGAPNRVVVAAGDECIEGVFACVTSRTVPAVVTESNGFGERDVESEGPGDRRCHLSDLESVCEACALVIVGEDEDLGLSGKTTKCRRMEDSVSVSLETGPILVGFFGNQTIATANGLGRS
jgi:hypothetical protein